MKPSAKRKLLVTLILMLLLLPFGSWYYLNQGLKWRKQAQEIMSGTTPFPAMEWTDSKGLRWNDQILEGKVSLVQVGPCSSSQDVQDFVRQLYEQFKGTQKANFIFLDTCRANDPILDSEMKSVYHIPCTDSTEVCKTLLESWPAGKSFALVDRKRILRAYYAAETNTDKQLLTEHMALLIPRERTEKVELKRGANK